MHGCEYRRVAAGAAPTCRPSAGEPGRPGATWARRQRGRRVRGSAPAARRDRRRTPRWPRPSWLADGYERGAFAPWSACAHRRRSSWAFASLRGLPGRKPWRLPSLRHPPLSRSRRMVSRYQPGPPTSWTRSKDWAIASRGVRPGIIVWHVSCCLTISGEIREHYRPGRPTPSIEDRPCHRSKIGDAIDRRSPNGGAK